jgi:hypothetical protein
MRLTLDSDPRSDCADAGVAAVRSEAAHTEMVATRELKRIRCIGSSSDDEVQLQNAGGP